MKHRKMLLRIQKKNLYKYIYQLKKKSFANNIDVMLKFWRKNR